VSLSSPASRRLQALFHAHVKGDEAAAQPKTVPCFESAGACWVAAEQLQELPLRSPRIPVTFFPFFAQGGKPGCVPPSSQLIVGMWCDREIAYGLLLYGLLGCGVIVGDAAPRALGQAGVAGGRAGRAWDWRDGKV
jgi:hypothetical protein